MMTRRVAPMQLQRVGVRRLRAGWRSRPPTIAHRRHRRRLSSGRSAEEGELLALRRAPYTSEAAVQRAGAGLLDRSLPGDEWTHQAHFAATLWLMRHVPQLDLPAAMPAIISGYNEAMGVPNSDTRGYHETITLASLRAARSFLDHHPGGEAAPLHEILRDLMASELGDQHWILEHWSPDLLFSPQARKRWAEPDLRPLPF